MKGKHILIILEGFPVPLYKLIMQEAAALIKHGAEVSIISPKMLGYNRSRETLDGIRIYRHPMPVEAKSVKGFILEYGIVLFWEFLLITRIFLGKRIHVIQGCTPPDLIFIPVIPFKLLGVKYVFHHLDLNPELYISKYGRKGFVYQVLRFFERLTFMTADYSIAPNETFKSIAVTRDGMNAERVAVIRSAPDLNRLRANYGKEEFKKGKKHLVGYIGAIGAQDSLDLLIRIIYIIRKKRDDVHYAILGDGTNLQEVIALSRELSLMETITFFGMVKDEALLSDIISSCDVCVNPDKYDEFNDKITAIKIMEYMALRKPIVQFDLAEGRYSAQDASLYAERNNLQDFADKICYLLDNEDEARRMGETGYQRIVKGMSWEHESRKLISLYLKVLKT